MSKDSAFKNFLNEKLQSVLSSYLKDFSFDLRMAGDLEFDNLEIREEILLLNNVPLLINSGKVGKIKIQLPLLNFKTNPFKVEIDGIDIRIRPLVEQRNLFRNRYKDHEMDAAFKAKLLETIESFKRKKLSNWEASVRKYFKALQPPGWLEQKIELVISNLIVKVSNVNIYYETSTIMNNAGVMKISFKELSVYPTDKDGNVCYNAEFHQTNQCIQLVQFAVAINMYSKELNSQYETEKDSKDTAKGTTSTEKAATEKQKNSEFEMDKKFHRLKNFGSYLLAPMDLLVYLSTERDMHSTRFRKPQVSVKIHVPDPVIVLLNNQTTAFLTAFANSMNTMKVVQKNLHLRPLESPMENVKGWWKYAFRSIREQKGRFAASTTQEMLKWANYKSLYMRKQNIVQAPWLPTITQKEEKELERLEEDLPLEKLFEYRELALAEIRAKAKQFYSSNKGTQLMKTLNIKASTPNNQESLATEDGFTQAERIELNQILSMGDSEKKTDPSQIEYDDSHEILNKILFHVEGVYLFLHEPKSYDKNQIIPPPCYNDKKFILNEFVIDPLLEDYFQQLEEKERLEANQEDSPTIENIKGTREPSAPQHKKPQDDNDQDAFHSFEEDNEDSFGSDDVPQYDKDVYTGEHDKKKAKEGETKGPFNLNLEDDKRLKDTAAVPKNDKLKTFDWSNQRLLLMVELLAINGGINKFRNGKVKTVDGLPISIKSFLISTALNLFEATRERIETVEDELNLFKNTDQSISKSIKYHDFLVSNILSVDFKNAGYEINPLVAYLDENNCTNIAEFLKTYQKYKDGSLQPQDNSILQNFLPFFDKKKNTFLRVDKSLVERFLKLYLENSKNIDKQWKVIMDTFKFIKGFLNQEAMPTFLINYGILTLPQVLPLKYHRDQNDEKDLPPTLRLAGEHLMKELSKDVIELHQRKPVPPLTPDLSKTKWVHLEIRLDMGGEETEVSSKRLDKLAKTEMKKGTLGSLKGQPGDGDDGPEIVKKVALRMKELTIQISTEVVLALALFFKNIASQASPSKKYQLVNQNFNVKEKQGGAQNNRKNSGSKGGAEKTGRGFTKTDSKSKGNAKKKAGGQTNTTITVKQYQELRNKINCEGADQKKKSA